MKPERESESVKSLINGCTVVRLITDVKLQDMSLINGNQITPGYSCNWNLHLSSKCYNIQVK